MRKLLQRRIEEYEEYKMSGSRIRAVNRAKWKATDKILLQEAKKHKRYTLTEYRDESGIRWWQVETSAATVIEALRLTKWIFIPFINKWQKKMSDNSLFEFLKRLYL